MSKRLISLSRMLPAMLMLASMFFCSTYYSFKDCFTSDTLYA